MSSFADERSKHRSSALWGAGEGYAEGERGGQGQDQEAAGDHR